MSSTGDGSDLTLHASEASDSQTPGVLNTSGDVVVQAGAGVGQQTAGGDVPIHGVEAINGPSGAVEDGPQPTIVTPDMETQDEGGA